MSRSELRLRLSAALRDQLAAAAAERGLDAWRLASQVLRAAAGLSSLATCPEPGVELAAAGRLDVSTSLRPDADERAAYEAAAEAADLSVGAWIRAALELWLEAPR